MQGVAAALSIWENFYVIIGSAAAGLTGLMFIVITLIAGTQSQRSGTAISAYGTPTIVHFCAALLVAAILSAPWQTLWHPGILIGLCGVSGIAYLVIVARRARRQTEYQPVLEDWLWHTIFPCISYTTLAVASCLLLILPALALFGIAGSVVLFLFIGIHNAWDTVTYIVIQEAQAGNKGND